MKKLFLFSCLFILINISYSNSIEIRKFNKYDDNHYFDINGVHCYNFGDSIIFYGLYRHNNPDSLNPQFCLFTYHNNELKRIAIDEINHDTTKSLLFLMGFIKDEENNYWFGFDIGGLYKMSETGITAYDSLSKSNSINQINSLLYDDKGDIWIHSNANLFRWDGNIMEQVIAPSSSQDDWYFIPQFLGNGHGLRQIGNKVYFQNMKGTLAYYDMVEKKVDTVSFYPYL